MYQNWEKMFEPDGLIYESETTVRYAIFNMLLYIINIFVNIYSIKKINRLNGRNIVRYNFLLTLFIWIFSCWGLEEIYSPKMNKLIDKYEQDGSNKYKDVYYMLILMIWIRLAFVVILLISSVIVMIVYCMLSFCGLLTNERY